MRAIVVMWALLSGCAALFQDRLKGEYRDARSEPQCTTSRGWGIVDGIFVLLDGVAVTVALDDKDLTDEDRSSLVLGGLLDLAVHAVSAVAGFGWASDCEKAYVTWQAGGASEAPSSQEAIVGTTNDPDTATAFWCGTRARCTTSRKTCVGNCVANQRAWCMPVDDGFVCGRSRDACSVAASSTRSRSRGECVARHAGRWGQPEPEVEPPAPVVAKEPAATTPPRGHFCAASDVAAVCAREKRDCETGRNVALGAVPDLAECMLVETVFCFGELCTPSLEMCQARSAGAACEERK